MNNFELHYGTGGHGGPYATLELAVEAAQRMIIGCENERRIDVRAGVNGPILATVKKVRFETTEVTTLVYV